MILAALILKLSGYGFLRYMIPLCQDSHLHYGPLLMTIATTSLVYASLISLRQIDLKKLVAYSSIAHMALALGAVSAITSTSVLGIVMLL